MLKILVYLSCYMLSAIVWRKAGCRTSLSPKAMEDEVMIAIARKCPRLLASKPIFLHPPSFGQPLIITWSGEYLHNTPLLKEPLVLHKVEKF